jgi:hypothetical protein
VRVDQTLGVVDWGSGSLSLRDATEIVGGKTTAVFKRADVRTLDPALCFSIVSPSRTLDLQAASAAECKFWVSNLKLLKVQLDAKGRAVSSNATGREEQGGENVWDLDPEFKAQQLAQDRQAFLRAIVLNNQDTTDSFLGETETRSRSSLGLPDVATKRNTRKSVVFEIPKLKHRLKEQEQMIQSLQARLQTLASERVTLEADLARLKP